MTNHRDNRRDIARPRDQHVLCDTLFFIGAHAYYLGSVVTLDMAPPIRTGEGKHRAVDCDLDLLLGVHGASFMV